MDENPISPWLKYGFLFLFAAAFSCAGLFVLMAAFDLVEVDPASIHAPRWVLAAAGLMFIMGGFMIILRGTEDEGDKDRFHQWAEYFVIAVMMAAFSSIFLWVGFGSGERTFETETSFGPVSTTGQGDELTGRCLFGVFGLATALGTLYYIISRPLIIFGLWTPPRLLRGNHLQRSADEHNEHDWQED